MGNFFAKMTKISKDSWPWLLVFLAIFWGLFLYVKGLPLTGPFIFGDESTYFSFARNIFLGKSISTYTQYGPLYPALISPMFSFEDIVKTYQAVRIFNIVVFISAAIPAYFLAQTLFTNKYLRVLLPLCVVFTPFSGFVYLVWAEPLYIALFYWACFLLYQFTKEPSLVKSLLLGVFLSLLFYTKTAAGLVAQIAAFSSLVVYLLVGWRTQTKKNILLTGLAVLTCLAMTFPWMLHYHHLGVSIIGYPIATTELASRVVHQGYQFIVLTMFRSLFYQFSYVVIGSWGMFGLYITLLVMQWRQLSAAERTLIVFTIICAFGLMALSALGMTSFAALDYRMPNGRYFSLLLPLIIALSLHLLFKTKLQKKYTVALLLTILLTTLVVLIATPLYTRSPFAYNSMPDLSSIIYFSDNGRIVWRASIEEPSILLRTSVALFFGFFALGALLLRQWRYEPQLIVIIISVGVIFGSWVERDYLFSCGVGQSEFSEVFIGLKKKHINIDQVEFDKKLEPGNAQFLAPFWMDRPAVFQSAEEVMKGSHSKTVAYFVSQDRLSMNKLFVSGTFTIYEINHPQKTNTSA